MALLFNRPFDDRRDKQVLLGCFLIGFATIVVLRGGWFGPVATGQFHILDMTAAFIAVAIIGFYTAYIYWTRDRTGVSVDRASDNAYYLGLIFTLVSLSVSLLKMLRGFDLDDPVAVNSALLPDFGLALFSTIAGIVARILLQQFRPEIDDVEADAARQLQLLMQSLQGSIQRLVGNLDGLRKQTEISMSEMIEKSGEMMSSVTENVSDVILTSTAKNEELLSGVAATVNQLGEQSTKQLEALVAGSEGVAKSMTNFGEALKGLEELSGQINQSATQQKHLADSMVKTVHTVEGVFSSLKDNRLPNEINNTVEKIQDLGIKSKQIGDEFDSINEKLQRTSSMMGELERNIASREEVFRETSQTAEDAAEEYVDALGESAAFLRGKKR